MSKIKIRYYGHVGQTTGYGIAAGDLCMALSRHPGVDLQIVPLQPEAGVAGRFLPLASRLRRHDDPGLDPTPDAVVVHTLPMDCRRVLQLAKLWPPRGRQILVAQTTWEAQGQASVIDNLTFFNQVWSPSRLSLASLSRHGIDTRLIPHCFDEAIWQERVDARQRAHELRDKRRHCFYYVGATSSRKNLQGLLRAWAFAFTDADDDVLLRIVAPANDVQRAALIAQTGLEVAELAPLEWRSVISDADLQDLHWILGDCFVTASRGEAWNLPAFDAMLAGRHVISPWCLGSDDFLSDTSADLYNSSLAPAYVDVTHNPPSPTDPPGAVKIRVIGAQGISSRCLWREPDLQDLARRMLSVRRTRQRTLHLKYNPIERYGYTAVANMVVETLTQGPKT